MKEARLSRLVLQCFSVFSPGAYGVLSHPSLSFIVAMHVGLAPCHNIQNYSRAHVELKSGDFHKPACPETSQDRSRDEPDSTVKGPCLPAQLHPMSCTSPSPGLYSLPVTPLRGGPGSQETADQATSVKSLHFLPTAVNGFKSTLQFTDADGLSCDDGNYGGH